MHKPSLFLSLSVLAGLVITACENSGSGRVLEIDATGRVEGLVFFDANGSRAFEDVADFPLEDVGVRLLDPASRDTVVRTDSDEDGLYDLLRVPVGSYEVTVDPESIEEGQVVVIDSALISVAPDDSLTVDITVSFPVVTIDEAREVPPGLVVFVEGVTLNSSQTFGDQSVHLADENSAIRTFGAEPGAIALGDSVRVLGVIDTFDGQPVLAEVITFDIAAAAVPVGQRVTTEVAAGADAGRLDAALVEVNNALINDTATVAGDLVLSVDDNTGPLDVVLDADIIFRLTATFVPGAVLRATGLLVPNGPDTWALKPRFDADLQAQ